ncbi:unnamed protein product, partial [Choristocarpus tenellus]
VLAGSAPVREKNASQHPGLPPEQGRTWWRCDVEERRVATAILGLKGRCQWAGLEESLSLLASVWDRQGPFDGLMGFSQGAAMASVFYHCMFEEHSGVSEGIGSDVNGLAVVTPPALKSPRFGIFVSGCFQPHPTQVGRLEGG